MSRYTLYKIKTSYISERREYYFLRSIIFFANIDVARHILVLNISILAKSNMNRREYVVLPRVHQTGARDGKRNKARGAMSEGLDPAYAQAYTIRRECQ
jgi:hypothetical protein